MSLLKFLNDNAGAFNVAFGAVVALATGLYAILTRSLVRETAELRLAQTEPQISVWIEPSEHWINLINIVIANHGSAPALDVRLSSEPDFETQKGERLSNFGVFKHGIRVLAPGQHIRTRLTIVTGQIEEIERPNGRYEFVVRAQYRSVLGRRHDMSFPIDFRHLIGLRQGGSPPLHTIAKAVQELQGDVHRLATGLSKLRVIRQTQEEERQEEDEILAEFKERRARSNSDGSKPDEAEPPA